MWVRREGKYDLLGIFAIWVMLMAWALLVQCSHLQTHEGKCDEALKKYNNAMATYRLYYPAQSPETQAKWKREIAPQLRTMSQAVDMCPTDISGYDTAMLVFDQVQREFIAYNVKMKEE